MVMCMLLCTVICSPRLKCPVLCADFIVLAFCIFFIPYCCDFYAALQNNYPFTLQIVLLRSLNLR